MEAADRQQQNYHSREPVVKLQVGQEVLLNNPTKGKLDPRWTGPWEVRELKGPLTVKIRMNNKEQIVHVNRVRPLLRPDPTIAPEIPERWDPPLFHHHDEDFPEPVISSEPSPSQPDHEYRTTRSGRIVKPVDYYGIKH